MNTASEEIFSPHDIESIIQRIKIGGVQSIKTKPLDAHNSFDDGDVLHVDEEVDLYEFTGVLINWLANHQYPIVRLVFH